MDRKKVHAARKRAVEWWAEAYLMLVQIQSHADELRREMQRKGSPLAGTFQAHGLIRVVENLGEAICGFGDSAPEPLDPIPGPVA